MKLFVGPLLEQQVENGFCILKETVGKFVMQSAYRIVNLSDLFSGILRQKKVVHNIEIKKLTFEEDDIIEEEEGDTEC